jgi:hypothetical protein
MGLSELARHRNILKDNQIEEGLYPGWAFQRCIRDLVSKSSFISLAIAELSNNWYLEPDIGSASYPAQTLPIMQ